MYHYTESQIFTTSEIPTLAIDSNVETISNATPTNDMVTRGKDDHYTQDVLIGMIVTAAVFGVTQTLFIVVVVILTAALVKVNRKYKKAIQEQSDLQMKSNSAYGMASNQTQVVYDYI